MKRAVILAFIPALLAAAAAADALPAPTGLAASVDSCWGVRLSWNAVPGAFSYHIRRGDAVFETSDLFYRDTAAPAGSTLYWVAGIDLFGIGDSASATGFRPSPPEPPPALSASDSSCSIVRLDWSASADADSYQVWRGGALIASLDGSVLFYEDDPPPGAYLYGVSASNPCGRSDTTAAPGVRLGPPAPPGSVAASDTSCHFILVTWTDAPDEEGYRVYRDGSATPAAELPADVLSWKDETVEAGVTHTYKVSSVNICGETDGGSAEGERIFGYPATPVGVDASDGRCDSVVVTWAAATEPADADSYVVYFREQNGGGGWERVGSATSSPYRIAHAPAPGNYTYYVSACNHCGCTPAAAASQDEGSRDAPPGAAPVFTAESDTAACAGVPFRLVWKSVPGADSYTVIDGAVEIPVGADTFWVGSSDEAGARFYRARAGNHCGEGSESDPWEVKVLAPPVAPPSVAATDTLCGAVRIFWDASAEADSYRVWREGALVATVGAASLTYEDPVPAGIYLYGISAGNECGWSDSSVVTGTSAGVPDRPASAAASDTSCLFIRVEWSASADADSYRVFRDGAPAATVDGSILFWEDAVPPGEYLYGVAAGNRCGWSDTAAAPGSTLPSPVPPGTVVASDTSCVFVRLDWSAAPGAEEYRLFRDGAALATVDGAILAYRDTIGAGAYLYGVASRNACGWSDSAVAEGRVRGVPAQPAAAATDTLCGAVLLSWSASAEADSYRVFRDGAPLASVGAATLTHEDPVPSGAYLYAVSAGNACGWSDTAAATGLSLGPPPPPPSVSASDDSCGFVRIVWNAVAEADSYAVLRGGAPIAAVAETTFADAPPPGTYLYAVVARNRCGDSEAVEDEGTRPPDAPPPPEGLWASADSCGFILVRWSPAPDAAVYEVLRDGAPLGSTADTLYRDDEAASGMSYLYTVRASNDCGVSEGSDAAEGVRPPDPPAPPGGLAASSDRCDGILLSWTDTEAEEGYVVLRDGAAADTIPAETVSWLDAAAGPGTHIYRVGAFNGCSEAPSFGDSAEGFLLPPPPPVTDIAADSICGGVRLIWSDTEWEAGYVVVRLLDEEGIALDTLGPDETSYEDLAADTGAVYRYGVGAFNACHPEPVFGSFVEGVRPWDAPAPPAGVSAGEGVCGRVQIDWLRSPHADGYRVFRNGVFIAVTELPLHSDTEAPVGTHLYKVKAYNSCGVSEFSDADAGSRPPDAPAAPTGLSATKDSPRYIRLTWNDTQDEEGYKIYRDGAGIPIIVLGPNSVSYDDNAVESGVHTYRVEAYNGCGSGITNSVQGERTLGFPSAPTGVSATDDRCDEVIVTWSYLPGELAAVDYFVVSSRDLEQGPQWDSLGAVTGQPFRWIDTPQPGDYEYRVVAVNEFGSSPETEGSKDEGTRLGPPGAPSDFTLSPADVCGGRPFTLSWRPAESAVSYEWEEVGGAAGSTADTSVSLSREAVGTYSFRVRAAGVCGAGDWSDSREVEIQALPAAPADPSATDELCGAIRLSWTPQETGGVWIETDTGTVFLDGPDSWTDSLPEGGARIYPVGGWNACDTLAASDTVSGAAFPLAIEAPFDVTASDDLCDSVVVEWGWNSDPAALDSFRVVRSDGPVTSRVAVVPAGSPYRAVDRSIQAGRRYAYRVRAFGRCAQAAGAPDTGSAETRPAPPAWNNPQPAACAGIPYLLRWNAVSGAEEYILRESDTLVAATDTTEFLLRPDRRGSFTYTVSARNGCGESGTGAPWVLHVGEAPSAPEGAVLDSSYCDSVVITWEAQEDSVRIYRSDRIAPVWIGPGDGRFVDRPGRAVVYNLRGFNGCGESDGAEVALLLPRMRPRAPSSVTASDGFCDSVTVAWGFPASDASIRRIEVHRVRNDTIIVVADSLPPETRRYVDRDGRGIYIYEVYAGNACGVSPAEETSRDEGGFLPTAPRGRFAGGSDGAACAGDSFSLHWEPWEDALDYRLSETVGGLDQPTATLPAGVTGWRGFAAAEGERVFRIRARGICGFGERSDPWAVEIAGAPDPPEGLAASEGLCGMVRLSWRPPEAGVERVHVYREGEPAGAVEAPDTVFVDSTVVDGVVYAYEAAAENACGLSARLGPVSGSSLPGLPAPVPESPGEGTEDLPVPVALRWTPVDGAAGYAVRVEPIGGGNAPVDTLLDAEETALLLFWVEPGGAYRWRVATRSACGTGVPSAWRAFTVGGAAPAALATFPPDGETEAPPDLTILVRFNFPVDPERIGSARLLRNGMETVGSLRLEENGTALLFQPAAPLAFGSDYLFRFDGLLDIYGRMIEGRTSISFTVQPALRPFGDLNGDYRRDLEDVLLADSILIGLRGVPPLPMELVDLNGDYRFNVADLVMLGRALVDEGPSAHNAGEALPPARAEAAAEPADLPGRVLIFVDVPVGRGASACCLEASAEGGSGRFLSTGGEAGRNVRIWRSAAGSSLRILLAAQGNALLPEVRPGMTRIAWEWEGSEPPERIRLNRILLAGGAEGRRDFAAGTATVGRSAYLHLTSNRPNPFNPSTEIHYYLPEPARVRVAVYDIAGRVAALLADGDQPAGWRTAVWDGRLGSGATAASGIYFCRVEANGRTRVIRMTLLR